jgi:transposase
LTGERKRCILSSKQKSWKRKETSLKKNTIELTKEQRANLEEVIKKGQGSARKIQHAHVLLKSDTGADGPGWPDEQIQEAFEVGRSTIQRIRRRFLEQGLSEALNRRPQPERPEKRKVYGEHEAHLIALCCSPAPDGYERWSMRLLADRVVELGYFEKIGPTTIWKVLKKMNSNPG